MIPGMDSTGNGKLNPESQKQIKILLRILEDELTGLQRQAFWAYHFEKKTITRIAEERGVNKSTICRTLKRAEKKVMRCTKYLRM